MKKVGKQVNLKYKGHKREDGTWVGHYQLKTGEWSELVGPFASKEALQMELRRLGAAQFGGTAKVNPGAFL